MKEYAIVSVYRSAQDNLTAAIYNIKLAEELGDVDQHIYYRGIE